MNYSEAQQYIANSNAGKVTWDDNARAQANNIISGGGGGGGGGMSFADAAKQMMQMYQEAAKPAIASLQASIPETQAKYTQQKTQLQAEQKPLEERYKNLLDEVTRRENVAVGAAELATGKELGVRGIVPSSGLYDKSILGATQPIRAEYTTMYKDTALERESALRNLSNLIQNVDTNSIEGIRAIQNAIANLQAGAGAQGVTQGLGLYTQSQNAALAAQQQALAQQAEARAQKIYEMENPYNEQLLKAKVLQAQAGLWEIV